MTSFRPVAASLALAFAFAGNAVAATASATDATRLSSQYSDWAGGRSNSDSLVAGLRNGAPVTLVTNGADRSVSIAGFTPGGSMSYGSVASTLDNAKRSLARIGIDKPTAEQIQAAIIGGEVTTKGGATTMVKGSVTSRGTPVASR